MASTSHDVAALDRRRRPADDPSLVHSRNGRLLTLTLATVTMVVEMCSLLTGTLVWVGDIGLSFSVIPALLLLLFLGSRSMGASRDRDRLIPFWIAMGAGTAMGAALFNRTGDLADLGALLFAAMNEELVYRFAVPVVLTAGLIMLRVPATAARVAGYVAAAVWWIALPGHQQQMASSSALVTYAAFALISAVVVARSRALVPMGVAHFVLNVITFSTMRGDITEVSRSMLSGCLLFLLIGTFAWPGDVRRRAADKEDLISDTVIDLRDGARPSITVDGQTTYVDDDPAADADPTPAPVPSSTSSSSPSGRWGSDPD